MSRGGNDWAAAPQSGPSQGIVMTGNPSTTEHPRGWLVEHADVPRAHRTVAA